MATDDMVTPTRFGRSRRPTSRDVSRLAGVSRMTVSRVLVEPNVVLPATRERVLKAMADLGYVPDKGAGGLASRRTGFIGLILPTLTNANFAMVAHGLTDSLRARGFDLLIAYTDYDPAEEERQIANLLARRPEAILLTGPAQRRASTRMLMMADIPIIELADLPERPIGHAVGFSNHRAGSMAARYLISRGFSRIGALAGATGAGRSDFRGEERVRGFADELRAQGLSTDLVLRHGEPPLSFDHGAANMGLLLDRDPSIEAAFAVSDLSAVGAVMECRRRGLDVPGDLSVMGFGDFEIGRAIVPALTTIAVDFNGIGRKAGELLLEIVAGERADLPRSIDVRPTLVERQSVASRSA